MVPIYALFLEVAKDEVYQTKQKISDEMEKQMRYI